MKQTVRLRENELRRMISESVKRVLRENQFSEDQIHDWYVSTAKEMGCEDFIVLMWTYYFSKNIGNYIPVVPECYFSLILIKE